MGKRHDQPLNIRPFIHDAHLVKAEMQVPGQCRLYLTSDFISAHNKLAVDTIYTITIKGAYAADIKAYRYTYTPRLVSEVGDEKIYETEYSEFEEFHTPEQFADRINSDPSWEILSGETYDVDESSVLKLDMISNDHPSYLLVIAGTEIMYEAAGVPTTIEYLMKIGTAYWEAWRASTKSNES